MNNHPQGTAKDVEETTAEEVFDEILSEVIFEVACGVHRAAKTGALSYSALMLSPLKNGAAADGNDDALNDPCAKDSPTEEDDGDATTAATGDGHDASGKLAEAGNATRVSEEGTRLGSATRDGNENKSESEGWTGQQRDDGSKKRKFPDRGEEQKSVVAIAVVDNKRAAGSGGSTVVSSREKTDIYGRTPGKDAKYAIPCPNDCGRMLTSSRMTSHLEKCLGLVSRRRNSSSSSGPGRKGSGAGSSSSHKGGVGKLDKGNVSKVGKVNKQGKQAKKKSWKMS